jgi:ParB-like chromosome segregation protein Spo0J
MTMAKQVRVGFDRQGVTIPVINILPVKQLKPIVKASQKYHQILCSVREVGIIEPLMVFPQEGIAGRYLLLDGHVRLQILKDLGRTRAPCLIATDDEAYSYNKRINRIATIQEHMMILKAIKSGVSEERIARVLNVDVASIRQKRDLLDGICKEAVEILKTRQMSHLVFGLLKKMKPMRQIEVVELLATASNFSVPYTKALLAATKPDGLVEPDKHRPVQGLTSEQAAKMQGEMEVLQRELKLIEESHGNEMLNLVLARGYLGKLLGNGRITRYLNQNHTDILRELQSILEESSLGTEGQPSPPA